MAVSIFVHDLGSREIRVRFGSPVSGADSIDFYTIVADPGPAYVPDILSVTYYDADKTSVQLTLSAALTRGSGYLCTVSGLVADDGNPVTTDPFAFSSTDVDRPLILGVFQSDHGCVDIVCDRPVAETSTAAVAYISTDGGPGVLMTLVPWAAGRQTNSVRFLYTSADPGTNFTVIYSDITDISGNVAFGEAPLVLAYAATGYADLMQARAVSARIVDVSNAAGFAASVVRVFFNCPMYATDVLNTSNWTASQTGAHADADIGNQIVALDAFDLPTLIILVNEAKAKANAHFLSHAHFVLDRANLISDPDASDFPTALYLLQSEQAKLLLHFDRSDSHTYQDHVHPVSSPQAGSLADAIIWANEVKSSFNAHLAAMYPLSFSSAYSPLQPISNFASSANADQVWSQFTWFADLRLATDTLQATLEVSTVGIQSEDLTSSSSDTLQVECASSVPTAISAIPLVRGVVLRMDGGVEIPDVGSVSLKQGETSVKISRTYAAASVPSMVWAFNNVLHAYKMHISDPAISPHLGAGHTALDTVHTVSIMNYATTMSLGSLMLKANSFKYKLSAHMSSSSFHFSQDAGIEFPDATDVPSLIDLIEHLQMRMVQHNSSGFSPNGDVLPSIASFHSFPGVGIVSASVCDLVVVETHGMEHGVLAEVSIPVVKIRTDNRPGVSSRTIPGLAVSSFTAVDTYPVFTSAVARPGINLENPSPCLLSDAVELYLSKPMKNLVLSLGATINISGMTLLDASWIRDRVASVRVTNMATSIYSVDVVNLEDVAGNPLYEPWM